MEICENVNTHVTEGDWKPLCGKAKQIGREYMETECVVKDTAEKLIISFMSDSNRESDSGV
jgi:hypothetical protein